MSERVKTNNNNRSGVMNVVGLNNKSSSQRLALEQNHNQRMFRH